jgi:hypothetical protein
MLIKLFVGLNFDEGNHFAKKIQNYRMRYDEKVVTNSSVYMPLIPPFEVPVTSLQSLQEELREELESFFNADQSMNIGFTGIDVHSYSRKSILYLKPMADEDLGYATESLFQICREHAESREHAPSKDDKGFLTIGRFTDPSSLHAAISVAQREFADCTSLPLRGVCLFQKNNGVWYQQNDLHQFSLGPSPLSEER